MFKHKKRNDIVGLIYPARCCCCGVLLERQDKPALVCGACLRGLKRTDEQLCIRCGNASGDCDCMEKRHVYQGSCAPFFHAGFAQQGIFRLKFRGVTDGARFFGLEMAAAVRRNFPNRRFDGVAYVPLETRRRMTRGYDQAKCLAKYVGAALNAPVYPALRKTRSGQIQHELPRQARIENVRNAYQATAALHGVWLLVDDVRTTGATLDCCADLLLRAGAKDVYCVTATVAERTK